MTETLGGMSGLLTEEQVRAIARQEVQKEIGTIFRSLRTSRELWSQIPRPFAAKATLILAVLERVMRPSR